MNSRGTRHSGLEQFALVTFTCAAIASFAFSQKAPWAWVFVAPCVAGLFWRIKRLPAALVRWTRISAWAILGVTFLVGLLNRSYPVLSDETVKLPLLVAGLCLSFFAALFLLGSDHWSPAWTYFPVAVGVLLIAALNPFAPHPYALLVVAGAAAFVYLIESDQPRRDSGEKAGDKRRRWARAAMSGVFVSGFAWGIIQILPWLQVRVVQATNRLVVPQANFFPGLSQVSRLGDLEELQLSQRVVMRIWTSQPQKLRGRVFTLFDGRAWHAATNPGKSLMPAQQTNPLAGLPGESIADAEGLTRWTANIPGNTFILPRRDGLAPARRQTVRTQIIQEVYNGGMLAMPGNKLMVRLASPYLHVDAFENMSQPSLSPAEIYGVVSFRDGRLVQEDPGDAELLKSCLALPADTDSRFKTIAEQFASVTNSPAERIQKTLKLLQSQCRYSLKVGKFHTSQPAAEFLFEKKAGYCEYFASAAAILLRLQGVPTRYVTGFNVEDGNREGSHYVVREADAHAWIESYVPGAGWVEVDPTPESEYEALHSNRHGSFLDATLEWFAMSYAEIAARLGQGSWLQTFAWIGGQVRVLFAYLVVSWKGRLILLIIFIPSAVLALMRRRKPRPRARGGAELDGEISTVPAELQEMIRRLDSIWSAEGFSRPASRAPLEHLTGIPVGKMPAAVRDSGQRIIEFYYRTTFGGHPFSAPEARELSLLLERAQKP